MKYPRCVCFIAAISILAGCAGGGSSSAGSASNVTSSLLQDRTWQTAQIISRNEIPNAALTSRVSADIATDGSGSAIAVWNQWDGAHFRVFSAAYDPGSGWASPVALSSGPSEASAPRIKYDSKGNALVVWASDQGMGARYYSRVDGWQNIESLPYYIADFDLATAPDDSFCLVVSYVAGDSLNVAALRYQPGGGWSRPKTLQDDRSLYGFQVSASFGADGTGFAAWVQCDRDITDPNSRKYVWASRYDVGTGWQPAERIGNVSAGDASYPEIGVDGDGNALVVWTQLDGNAGLLETTRSNIWFNRYRVGAGWDNDALLSLDNPGNAYKPALASEASGDSMIVWRQSTSWQYGTVQLWFRRLGRQEGWSATGKVSDEIYWGSDEGYQMRITTTPALVGDGHGNFLVAWDFENLNIKRNIASSRYASHVGWTRADLLDSPDAGYAYGPRIALDAIAQGTLIWCNGKGALDQPVFSIWGSRLD